MIDQKGEKRTNGVNPDGTEDRENYRTCLYVQTGKDDTTSPTITSKCLSGMGFLVTKMSKISAAKKLCKTTHYSLIVLEDCHDKKFIKDIKGPETCNEHTPIMYISSNGKLPDMAKDLTQEQYIDEVVFRCSTMEGDLVRAVCRLTAEPGQFAVTPTKCKRPPVAKKRKLDRAFSAAESPLGFWNKGANEGPKSLLAIQAAADSPDTADGELGCFPLSRPSPAPISGLSYTPDLNAGHYADLSNMQNSAAQVLYQSSVYESMGLQPLALNAAGRAVAWRGPMCEQHSFMYPAAYEHSLQSYYQGFRAYYQRDDSTIQGIGESPSDSSTSLCPHSSTGGPANTVLLPITSASAADQEPSVLLDNDGPNFKLKIDSLEDQAGPMSNGGLHDGKEVVPNSAKLPVTNAQMDLSATSKERQEQPQEPKNAEKATEGKEASKKSRRTCAKTPTEESKTSSAQGAGAHPSSAERSKEHHLEKERKRRVRITKCWHWLRAMVPHCSEYADKATVFEMTVAYLHHCWKHHGNLLDQINKDFEKVIESAGTPEDLEKMVSKTLAMERDIVQNLRNCLLTRSDLDDTVPMTHLDHR